MLILLKALLYPAVARLLLARGDSNTEPSIFSLVAAGIAMVLLSRMRRASDTDTD